MIAKPPPRTAKFPPMTAFNRPRRRSNEANDEASAADTEAPLSKTRRKAAMHDLQDLGEALVELSPKRLDLIAAEAELPERLIDAIVEARSITAWGGRKRQIQYVGKLMREVDAEPIRRRLDAWAHGRVDDAARQHALEALRESLLADATALDALLNRHPDLDRGRLATLIGRAREERTAGTPPHAYRELFRVLKKLDPSPS